MAYKIRIGNETVFLVTNNNSDVDLTIDGDLTINNDLTVTNDLTVQGTLTTIDTTNLVVEDPLIVVGSNNATDALDLGIIGIRSSNNVGIIWDESLDEFAAIFTTDDGTTSGDVTISSYADLQVGALTAASIDVGGSALSIDDLDDVDTTTDAPNANEILRWNGTDNWVPTNGLTLSDTGITLNTDIDANSNSINQVSTFGLGVDGGNRSEFELVFSGSTAASSGSHEILFQDSATDNAGVTIQILSGNDAVSGFFFSDTDALGRGSILFDHGGDSLELDSTSDIFISSSDTIIINPTNYTRFDTDIVVGNNEDAGFIRSEANIIEVTDGSTGLGTIVDIIATNVQVGTTYTLVAADNGKVITLDNASAITLTVPDSLATGFNCTIVQLGAGTVTVSMGGSDNLRSRGTLTDLNGQYARGKLEKFTSTEWLFSGDRA